jgi:two-component system response regulator HydG
MNLSGQVDAGRPKPTADMGANDRFVSMEHNGSTSGTRASDARLNSPKKGRILIVHPDPSMLALSASMLTLLGYVIEEASDDDTAFRLIKRCPIDVLLAGVTPSSGDALELLRHMRREHREIPVVLLLSRLDPDWVKKALRLGAEAVLEYPVPAAELRAAILQAVEGRESRPPVLNGCHAQHTHPSDEPGGSGPAPSYLPATGSTPADRIDLATLKLGLLGNDPTWRQVLDLAGILARTPAPLLIAGEPGTGKSRLAQLIHWLRPEPGRPFVTVEASTMADGSVIDGTAHSSSGALMSLSAAWSTNLRKARGGTLFIENVDALPIKLQDQLLLELQSCASLATRGPHPLTEAVRFLMSTSDDLLALSNVGRFRQELYHRINLVRLILPPLRYRGTDIKLLAEWFSARYAQEFHKPVTGLTRPALVVLEHHDWPGNVRELEAAIQRAVARCHGSQIDASDLAPIANYHSQNVESVPGAQSVLRIRPLRDALADAEKRIMIQALKVLQRNRQETARLLSINRSTLYKKMRKHGLLTDEPTQEAS